MALTNADRARGGRSTSVEKREAAQLNAKLNKGVPGNGRPAKYQMLGEYLMRESLTDFSALDGAWHRLTATEKSRLRKTLTLVAVGGEGYPPSWKTKTFTRGALNARLLKLFRYMARWEMKK